MEPREQFTFYVSFAKAARRIKKPVERCAFYDAIVHYALYGEEPDLDELPDIVAAVFEPIRPNLDAARRKSLGGKKGSPAKDSGKIGESSEEDDGKIDESSGKDSGNKKKKEDKKEDKKKKENECSLPVAPPEGEEKQSAPSSPSGTDPLPSPEAHFSGDLLSAVRDWLAYKAERREAYKPMGLQALFTQLRRAADESGEAAVVEIIRQSMASGYQGLTLDRLRKAGAPPRKGPAPAAKERPLSDEDWGKLLERI